MSRKRSPAELIGQMVLVESAGLPTYRLSADRSTAELHQDVMVSQPGFEPGLYSF